MADAEATRRTLKIKTGVVKRTFKDHNYYRDQVVEQQLKADELVADGAEEWDVKNAEKVLDESKRMVNDASKRLGDAVAELRGLVVQVKTDAFADDETLLDAEGVLEEANI